MKRATVYIVILGIVCTGSGVAVGIALEKRYTRTHLPRIVRSHLLQHPGAGHFLRSRARLSPEERQRPGAENILKRIDRELGLSSEQRDKVKAILEDTKKEIEQARDEFRTRIVQAKEKSNAEICRLLNSEQKERFQTMIERMKERIGRRRQEAIK